jgi:hypothetical protein
VAVAADVFDVVVDGRDAAAVLAARECARLGFRVALIDDPESWIFTPEVFVDFDDTMAELCSEFSVPYVVADALTETLNVAGIPGNPFNALVRERTGWSGAWRAYVDRIRPLLQIGTEDNLHRLVTKRVGAKVRDEVVVPELTRLYGIESADVSVNEVAHGLSEAMSRVGSLTGGVLELTAQEPRWTKYLRVTGGTHKLMTALDEAAEYFAVQRISRERSEQVTATVWLLDVATSAEHPSWQRAIVRARAEALRATSVLLSDPENPPVGPIDLAE